jgi:hypothetical protein
MQQERFNSARCKIEKQGKEIGRIYSPDTSSYEPQRAETLSLATVGTHRDAIPADDKKDQDRPMAPMKAEGVVAHNEQGGQATPAVQKVIATWPNG